MGRPLYRPPRRAMSAAERQHEASQAPDMGAGDNEQPAGCRSKHQRANTTQLSSR